MKVDELTIRLVRAKDDAETFSSAYQAELNQFYKRLCAEGTPARTSYMALDSVDAHGGAIGEFIIPLSKIVIPTLGAVLVAWLKTRSGRKVRLKVGDVQLEAQTPEQIDKIMKSLAELRDAKRNGESDNQ